MKLRIESKKDFISNVLSPISNLNDKTILKLEKNKISSITAANDATLILHSETQADCDFDKNLNIPDIKKLTRVLETVDTDTLNLEITNNSLKYSSDNFKFTYHLLEEGIIKSPTINVNKINTLKFDTTFKVQEGRLSSLFKGSSFTTETNKLYIFTENNKIYGELGDKNRHNSDNFQCVIADNYEGAALSKVIPVNFDTFRLINFNKCENIEFAINTSFGVIKTTLLKGKTKLTYIISALVN
jgi:hypothetical protein